MRTRGNYPETLSNEELLDQLFVDGMREKSKEAYDSGLHVFSTHISRTFPDYFNEVASAISENGWELVSAVNARNEDSMFVVFKRVERK